MGSMEGLLQLQGTCTSSIRDKDHALTRSPFAAPTVGLHFFVPKKTSPANRARESQHPAMSVQVPLPSRVGEVLVCIDRQVSRQGR